MMQKAVPNNVKKDKRVLLVKELPANKFGNKNTVPINVRVDVTSEGFVGGMLKVKFYTHLSGTENTQFNIESAATFLQTDV